MVGAFLGLHKNKALVRPFGGFQGFRKVIQISCAG